MLEHFIRIFVGRTKRHQKQAHSRVSRATSPIIETLEHRCLLSTSTFTTAATSGNSAAASIYIVPGANPGEVDVRYGSPTGFLAHQFTGTTDPGWSYFTKHRSNFLSEGISCQRSHRRHYRQFGWQQHLGN